MSATLLSGTRIAAPEALSIAQADAAGVYEDLDDYLVTTSLEANGWHVDYELRNPYLKGGGPHYLIHPSSGEILCKRYEQ